jgi:hypothetical protein
MSIQIYLLKELKVISPDLSGNEIALHFEYLTGYYRNTLSKKISKVKIQKNVEEDIQSGGKKVENSIRILEGMIDTLKKFKKNASINLLIKLLIFNCLHSGNLTGKVSIQ